MALSRSLPRNVLRSVALSLVLSLAWIGAARADDEIKDSLLPSVFSKQAPENVRDLQDIEEHGYQETLNWLLMLGAMAENWGAASRKRRGSSSPGSRMPTRSSPSSGPSAVHRCCARLVLCQTSKLGLSWQFH